MLHPFQFQASLFAGPDTTEANVLLQGYCAGYNDEVKQFLLAKIANQLITTLISLRSGLRTSSAFRPVFALDTWRGRSKFRQNHVEFAPRLFRPCGGIRQGPDGQLHSARTRAEYMGAALFD